MKRITFFINSLSSGGAEHQLCVLANFLQEHGYDVTIATFGDASDHYTLNKSIIRYRIGEGKSSVIKLLLIWWYFLNVKTDCVISFCQRNSYFALPALFLRQKIKVICGERNFSTGKKNKIENRLFRYLYKRANYIVPNSFSQEDYILSKCPKYKEKLVTITNYTDLGQYSFSSLPCNDIVRIGLFCRFEKQKNCLGLIDAINIATQRVPNRFIVEWYGNQSFKNTTLRTYFDSIIQKIKDLELENVIKVYGSVKNVGELLKQYDAICLPSFFEGFSNSISEAICSGRPILASDVSDNHIMVHDGINGYLFNPYDVEDIANIIIRFVELLPESKRQMGLKSREIAENLFDKNNFVQSYILLIES